MHGVARKSVQARTVTENQNLAAKLNAIDKSGICIGKWIPMRAKPLRMTTIKGIARRRETDAMTCFIAILVCAVLAGAYWLGLANGRLGAEEKHLWERITRDEEVAALQARIDALEKQVESNQECSTDAELHAAISEPANSTARIVHAGPLKMKPVADGEPAAEPEREP